MLRDKGQRIFLILVFAMPVALYGQSQAIDGNIEGYVRAQDGTQLSDAKVRVTNRETGLVKETSSDAAGHYSIQLLPPGTYNVAGSKEGFQSTVRNGVSLAAGQAATVEMQLTVGDVASVVEVKEEIPAVEVARTTAYSNVYTAREVRDIPVAGRSILDFFVTNPIVNAPPISTGGSGTGTPSVSYGGLGFRQLNVDGVSNNLQGSARNLVISQDAIGEFQTATNYPAEFGRQGGLLLNSFSRSGSNEWHGSGYLFTRQKVLAARPFLLAATTPTPDFNRYNWGGTGSGPIKKDRIFFFVSYERWQQDLPVVSTFGGATQSAIVQSIGGIPASSVGTYTTTFRAHTITAKGDWVLNDKNRLSLRYNFYRDRESPLNGGQQTREVGAGYTENPESGTFQLVTTVKPNMLNELRFLYIKRDIENAALDPLDPKVTISGIGSFNGNQDGTFRSYESGYQIIDNYSWNVGRHALKWGIEVLPASFQERTRNLNGTFTFSGLPALNGRPAVTPLNQYYDTVAGLMDPATALPYSYSQFARSIGQEFYTATVVNQGYFIQDDIRVNSRLKLNIGLRYELFLRPSGNLNAAYPATGKIPQDFNNFGPRLSLAWDPTGSGRSVFRAGYGIYYNTTVAQTFNTFLRGNGIAVQTVTLTPGQAGAPVFTRNPLPASTVAPGAISNLNVFAPTFNDPMVHSYFATFDREIFRDHTLSISYLGNQARDLPYAVPGNLVQIGTLPDGRAQYGGSKTVLDPRSA